MKTLSEILVDIPALRHQLIELMKDGFTEIPLDALLLIIRSSCTVEETE